MSDEIDETDPKAADRYPATRPEEAAASAEFDQLDAFDRLVLAAVESLPPEFRDRLGSVAIVVEDEATPDELASVGAAGLLGLYSGVPRTAWGADAVAMSSKITIYRLPHLQQFRTTDALARGVADTVRHEVAHHFGISDARLDQLAREGHRH
jgi:predicted Zn-dependent protease with MMP-like domain